jgi:putative nucleotidyltransferase with HDIG domain
MANQLDHIISKIEQLPTLPIVSQNIMDLMAKEDTSFQDLVKVVENDQSLTLKILKTANSAFYGSLSKISSLEHAMVKLGMNEVRSIVLGVSVHSFFSSPTNGTFDRERFWKHAIVCGQVAKYLGNYYKIGNDDTLFLSGLIHDMGKVILDEYFHEEFLSIIDYIDTHTTTFSKAEKAVVGTTHYQIAAKVLSQWKFPKQVIMQILFHHAPWTDKGYETNSAMVFLANLITKWVGFPCHPTEKIIELHEFSKSTQADFITKCGYELDNDVLAKLINHVEEFIVEETDNMMRFFD